MVAILAGLQTALESRLFVPMLIAFAVAWVADRTIAPAHEVAAK
jgi:hypothetical protein